MKGEKMQFTAGQTFYHRLSAAIEAQDLTNLGALYHPDAVSLSLGTGQVFSGREAILDSFQHTFQIAGAISSRSVESLVEAGEAVCVEATLATRFAQMQTYDVYLLQAGMVKQHVGGLISPRPPGGQRQGQGWPQTKGGAFYHRLSQAEQASDSNQLSSLYRPDAISVNCSAGQVHWGKEAIISSAQQASQKGSSAQLKSVEGFLEGEEIICAEVSKAYKLNTGVGVVQFGALTYEVNVLIAGQIGQCFSGLISPRWPELRQAIKQQNDLLFKLEQEKHRIRMNAIESITFHPRRWW